MDSVPGFEGVLLQVPEILPEEVLKAMHGERVRVLKAMQVKW